MSLSQGQTINNRYRIAKLLGESSFGTFYRAWDITANGPCILQEIYDTEAGRQVFVAQAQRLAGLANPGLPKVLDAFSLPGQGLYLAMEFVEGESLQAVFDRTDGPLPQDQVLPWMSQLCDAVACFHAQQPPLVCGGISPEGVRITPDGRARLIDFGPAAVYDAGSQSFALPQPFASGFSPPEQQGRGKVDARSDVYALGAVLYLLLAGKRLPESALVKGKDVPAPRPVHEINPQISPQLSGVIEQAIQIEPIQRFDGVAEFKQALIHAQQGAAPASRPVPAAIAAPPPPPKKRSRLGCVLGAAFVLLLLAGLIGGGWLAYPYVMEWLATATPIPTHTATLPPAPTQTYTPLPPTATPLPEESPTPEVVEPTAQSSLITDDFGVPMAFVEAGAFTMGSERGKRDEMPAHTVTLDAFYIDQYEVTNARYAECVTAGDCQAPLNLNSAKQSDYYGNPQFDNYPVIFVSWPMAQAYCEWRGGRLPTEAEWEKAARGSADQRAFPWGDDQPDCSYANIFITGGGGCRADVVEVGSYEKGVSPYMLYDMAGNVWEWVMDWYAELYYRESPEQNPTGPAEGVHRVMRGGAFKMAVMSARVTTRGPNLPNKGYDYAGFRCVKLP